MGEWVTSVLGDSFCSIAVASGFKDCDSIRNHQANQAIAGDQLQPGVRVYVPDLAEQLDSAPTETTHKYILAPSPFASIRFVHGSAGSPIPADLDSPFLEISNYRTDRAGPNGTDPFGPAGSSAFHGPSDVDPDAFKVEVKDTRTGLAQLNVRLEAMHPIYLDDLAIGTDTAWSSPAEAARRRLDLVVRRVTPKPDQRFRSSYLRLVVDEADKAGRASQTLLVTDDQPNEERVEILDQQVRATYILDRCPRPENVRCRVVSKLIDVGNPANKKRIRLCVGIIRRAVGDATGIHGVTEANIHHRLFRWVRRVYAQADCAPKLVPPGIRLLDPPERNMLTVSNITGARASGRTAGGASPSVMSFNLSVNRGGVVVNKPVTVNIPRAANFAARMTPKQVADQLVLAINDADFTATAFENPPVMGRTATQRSADVLVKDATGAGRVTISAARSTDAAASLRAAIVNLDSVRDTDAEFSGSMDERQIIRNFDPGDNPPDHLDCYVIGRWQDADTRGVSWSSAVELRNDATGTDVGAVFEPPPECRFLTMMAARSNSGPVMDGGNNLPYTFPHEMGHDLMNMFHTEVGSQLMFGHGTSVSAVMGGSKRINDTVRVVYGHLHPRQTTPYRMGNFFESGVQRIRTFGKDMLEDW